MASLYALTAEYCALADRLNDSSLPIETILDTLESESGDISDKITSYAQVITAARAEESAIIDAAEKMLLRAANAAKRTDWLENNMLSCMQAAKLLKVKSPWFVVSLKTSQRTIVDDAALIPADYLREKPAVAAYTEPDKALIKKAITDGFQVPGAHIEQHVAVSIKA